MSLGRTPGPIQTAKEEQSYLLGSKTVIGLKKGASFFRRLQWSDGHDFSLMSMVKSYLSLNISKAYGPSINADIEQLNKQMNCYGKHLRF